MILKNQETGNIKIRNVFKVTAHIHAQVTDTRGTRTKGTPGIKI